MNSCFNCQFAEYHEAIAGSIINEESPEEGWFSCTITGDSFLLSWIEKEIEEGTFHCPTWAMKLDEEEG